MISIVVRSKNEERWITHCLKALTQQTRQDFEVILVDNQSHDRTIERARHILPHLKVVTLAEYRPGYALNEGIRVATGQLIVCLSAHCIPVHENWLSALVAPLEEQPQVAGVYGRQVPTPSTRPADKRDLLITFGLDRRLQRRDSFFHNANSALHRHLWEKTPFDEDLTNIEDRIWAQAMIEAGYQLVYEPEASVYHHHGIHHTNERTRYENTARILDQLPLRSEREQQDPRDPQQLTIWALIPLRAPQRDEMAFTHDLLVLTAQQIRDVSEIDRAFLVTDDEEVAQWGRDLGLEVPFLRPSALSAPHIRVDQVLAYSLQELEARQEYADLLLTLEITYPFRPQQLISTLLHQQIATGVDSMIPGYAEYRPYWLEKDGTFVRMDDFQAPRDQRDILHIGLPSLACVTYPEVLRQGKRLGPQTGIHHLMDPIAAIEIRNQQDAPLLDRLRALLTREL